MQKQIVKKLLTIPQELFELSELRASQIGVQSFQEFVKYLLIKEAEKASDRVEILSLEDSLEVSEGYKDFKKGKYKNFEEIR